MARKASKQPGNGSRTAANPKAGKTTPPTVQKAPRSEISDSAALDAAKVEARRLRCGVRITSDGTPTPDPSVPYGVVSDGRV